jgi:hypothetical protein
LSPSLRGIKGEENHPYIATLWEVGRCCCGSNFSSIAEHHDPLRSVACRQRNASPLVKGDKVTNVGRTSVHELAILFSVGKPARPTCSTESKRSTFLSPSLRGIQWEAVPPARRTHNVLADGGLTEGDTGRFLSPSLRGMKGEEPLRALGESQLGSVRKVLCKTSVSSERGTNCSSAARRSNGLSTYAFVPLWGFLQTKPYISSTNARRALQTAHWQI